VIEALLTVLVGRGNPDGPPCKLLRPESDTLELDSRFRFELDAGGELILNAQNAVIYTFALINCDGSR
jgi:hypothetical protein